MLRKDSKHTCCPTAWRSVPSVTGDYDFDRTIQIRTNPAIPDKLALYTRAVSGAYGHMTGAGYQNPSKRD